MVRKTKEEALETRERILNAAIDVFYEQGVAKSSLEEIAEAAQVTRGAIYWHFKNKVDIFSAIHDRLHVSIMEGLAKTQENPTSDPLKDLMEFCITVLEETETNPQRKKIHSLFILKCDYSGEMAPFLQQQNAKKAESIPITTKFFEAAIKQGILPKTSNANLLAIAWFCYVCGIFNEYLTNPDLFNLKKQARPLIEQFFKNL